MWIRHACFRQDTMDAFREGQLRIIGFQCRREMFELSEELFFSQGGLLYGICCLQKIGNLKHVTRFKKVSSISKQI